MSLIRLLLYGLLAFFLIRIIRTVARMISTRRHEEPGQTAAPPRDAGAGRKWTDIRDAEFEDLTPPRSKSGDSAGGDTQ